MTQRIMVAGLTGIMAAFMLFAAGACRAEGAASGASDVLTVEVNGARIAYKDMGRGEPLLCIIGYGSTMDMWPPRLLEELAATRRVIVFDNRGMGLSTATDEPLSLDLMARDAVGLLDALGVDRSDVLGFSMGAYIALSVLRIAPDRCNKVVLYAGSPGSDQDVPPSAETLAQLGDSSGTPEERGMRLLSLMFPTSFMQAHPNPMDYFPAASEPIDPAMVDRQGQAIAERPSEMGLLPTIGCPVLVIAGIDDLIVPVGNARLMAGLIPGAVLVEVQGAGHGLMYQKPDVFRAYVECFLSQE